MRTLFGNASFQGDTCAVTRVFWMLLHRVLWPTFCVLILGKAETKVVHKPRGPNVASWQKNFIPFPRSTFFSLRIITWGSRVTSLPFISLPMVFRDKTNLSTKPRRIKKPKTGRSQEVNEALPTYTLPGASFCRSGTLHSLADWFCSRGSAGGLGQTGGCKTRTMRQTKRPEWNWESQAPGGTKGHVLSSRFRRKGSHSHRHCGAFTRLQQLIMWRTHLQKPRVSEI